MERKAPDAALLATIFFMCRTTRPPDDPGALEKVLPSRGRGTALIYAGVR